MTKTFPTHNAFWISKEAETMKPGDTVMIGGELHTMDTNGDLMSSSTDKPSANMGGFADVECQVDGSMEDK